MTLKTIQFDITSSCASEDPTANWRTGAVIDDESERASPSAPRSEWHDEDLVL